MVCCKTYSPLLINFVCHRLCPTYSLNTGGKLVLSIIFILFSLNWNRKLSLNYLQLYASGVKSSKDGGSRRRNSKKHGSDMSYDSIDSMSEPLSKNDINTIRRSQVWVHCIYSLIYDLYLPDF
jgi:hypothetical protein